MEKLIPLRLRIAALCVLMCAATAGCRDRRAPNRTAVPVDRERLMSINKHLVEKEKEVIELFVRRQGWRMQFAADGYYYEIFDAGQTRKPVAGDRIVCRRTVKLLDGTPCYASDTETPETFVVDGDDEISGLHRAVRMLGVGARARFVFPQRLAHGLRGDLDRIPPMSALVYTVEIIEIN